MVDYKNVSNDEYLFNEHVYVGDGEWRTVHVYESYAQAINDLRRSGLDFDNFTTNCYRYAGEQGFLDRDFSILLQWWIHNLDPEDPQSPYRFLVENYRCGSFEGFKGMKKAV